MTSNGPQLAVYYYILNIRKSPLTTCWCAALAIDRESIMSNLMLGGERLHDVPCPGWTRWLQHSNVFMSNPEKARALLRQAGYGPENPLPEITPAITAAMEKHKQLAETIQQMWSTPLDACVRLKTWSGAFFDDEQRGF